MPVDASKDLLYTVCLDYSGGTYLSQSRSLSVSSAIESWAEDVTAENLKIWRLTRDDLRSLAQSDAVQVGNLSNVFCISETSKDKKLMLAHVIGTLG